MLSPVSLRICWVATMAPALTEAASQAEGFNLPCSPTSSDKDYSTSPLNLIKRVRHGPILGKFSLSSLHKIAQNSELDFYPVADSTVSSTLTDSSDSDLAWNDLNREQLRFDAAGILGLTLSFNGSNSKQDQVTLRSSPTHSKHLVGAALQERQGGNGQTYVQDHTMSKNDNRLPGTMGLLNANASLDCELKSKFPVQRAEQSAFSSHEQMLLFSDPEKQERCTDLPFEVDDDKLPTEMTEALLNRLVGNTASLGLIEDDRKTVPLDNGIDNDFRWSALENPPSETKVAISEKKNCVLKRRTSHLLRRIRKLQMRQVEFHTQEQLQLFVDNQRKIQQIALQKNRARLLNSAAKIKNAEDFLHSKDVKNLTATALIDLVKELESSKATHRMAESFLNATDSGLMEEIKEDQISKFEMSRATVTQTAGTLKGVLHHLESSVVDSDATESSSGGESGDEAVVNSRLNKGQALPLHKRAYWRWTIDRAAVASRWAWLQAQVSDLEYRIRQQNEVYRQLKLSKSPVKLLDESLLRLNSKPDGYSVASGSSTQERTGLPASFNQMREKAPQDGEVSSSSTHQGNLSRFQNKVGVNGCWPIEKPGNGYNLKKLGENSSLDSRDCFTSEEDGKTSNEKSECCRTKALVNFRKRKLVKTMGMHLAKGKASKLASISCDCNCQKDYLPCIMCSGRYNSVQSLDPEVMPMSERVALLDQSFHPRLSFKHGTATGIQYENLIRRNWFNKMAKLAASGLKKKKHGTVPPLGLSNQAQRHSRKLTKNAAQTLLTARNKDGSKRRRIVRANKNDENCPESSDSLRRVRVRRRSGSISSGSSKHCSPSPSPVPPQNGESFDPTASSGKIGVSENRRKRLDDAYDINNIVIPYSIASATRLEKLQYKEILTPKWRVLETEANLASPLVDDNEDISDETFLIRHLKCEEEEKQKFRSYVNVQGRSRSRSIRTDSRADSSGANTPDPMSPAPNDLNTQDSSQSWNSPVASPPPFSCSNSSQNNPSDTVSSMGYGEENLAASSARSERKRILSICKRNSEEDRLPPPPLFGDDFATMPYESRSFPLTEDEYEEMIKVSTHIENKPIETIVETVTVEVESSKEAEGFPPTPLIESSGGSVPDDDDPNDPEWVSTLAV